MTEARGELWGGSNAYEQYMGRWSRKLAPMFLEWLEPSQDAVWVDVGCGTGVLSQAIVESFSPASVLGVEPSSTFMDEARARIPDERFTCISGSADVLTSDDDSIDYAVSGLVLNFVPDKRRAVDEMVRALTPGGKAALYVWDYAGHMQIMRYFFDAAAELDAGALEFDDGVKSPVCRPGPLQHLFEHAGLRDVSVHAIDTPTAFKDFDDYWTPFLGGTGSAPKYYTKLDVSQRAALRERVRQRIPTGPDGEILLAVRAWAVQGTKAGR